jgi:hypothetical protein
VTSPADATGDQRPRYELACRAAVRRRVEFDGGTLLNGRRVTAVEVLGNYPDTELVVSFVKSTGETDSKSFDIWRSDPPGDITDPNDAGLNADLIWVAVAGM